MWRKVITAEAKTISLFTNSKKSNLELLGMQLLLQLQLISATQFVGFLLWVSSRLVCPPPFQFSLHNQIRGVLDYYYYYYYLHFCMLKYIHNSTSPFNSLGFPKGPRFTPPPICTSAGQDGYISLRFGTSSEVLFHLIWACIEDSLLHFDSSTAGKRIAEVGEGYEPEPWTKGDIEMWVQKSAPVTLYRAPYFSVQLIVLGKKNWLLLNHIYFID